MTDIDIDLLKADLSAIGQEYDSGGLALAYITSLEQRVEGLERAGHSMDCDVRKDSASAPECSCGWAERIASLAIKEES